MQRLEVSG